MTGSLEVFYEASAGVAGALIGLLFVAVSVAMDRTGDEALSRHQIPAAGALTSFTNALLVSLVGLLEHGQVANVAGGAGIAGLMFVAASVLSLIRRRALSQSRDLFMLAVMAATFIVQMLVGFSHSAHPGAYGVQHTIGIIMIISFLSGISRAWELTGARRLVLSREIGSMVGLGTGSPAVPAVAKAPGPTRPHAEGWSAVADSSFTAGHTDAGHARQVRYER